MTDHLKRYSTPAYDVTVSWFGDADVPQGVHVRILSRVDAYEVNHAYSFARDRYGGRRNVQVRLFAAHDYRFGVRDAKRLGKHDKKPALDIARRYARAILTGHPVPGECGCGECGGVGWEVDGNGRYQAKCVHCDGGFVRPARRAA